LPAASGSGARRLLSGLGETASRSNLLEPVKTEIAGVIGLLEERFGGQEALPAEFVRMLHRCAVRWYRHVKGMPGRNNSLAVDIAFNLELAGFDELAADLFEAIVCLENGAFRASRLMSRVALGKALVGAGAPGETLESRLGRAKETGLITSSDMRSAIANHGASEESADEGGSSAESALGITLRLCKKLLRAEIGEGLRKASAAFRSPAGLRASIAILPAPSADGAGSEQFHQK
jgi:hypothetical protein